MQNYWPTVPNPNQPVIANRYVLEVSLGEGGFGEVFQARDTKFDPPRLIALKLLHRRFLLDPQMREDIKREASSLARFNHPNILHLLDYEIGTNSAYLVTELAEGGSLARKLRPDPTLPPISLSLDETRRYLEQIADGLDEAHAHRLIHRDINPKNILLDKRGRILLADFGLAMPLGHGASSKLVSAEAFGTAEYAAPEVWQDKVNKASDIYALGVVLYQMLTGYPPYEGSVPALMKQHFDSPIPHLIDRLPLLRYPAVLDDVIARAMAKDPEQRYKTAGTLYQAFKAALGSPKLASRHSALTAPFSLRGLVQQLTDASGQFDAAEARKDWNKAIELGERMLKRESGNQLASTRVATIYEERAVNFYEKGNYNAAIADYSRAIALNPSNAQLYDGRGRSHFGKGHFHQVIADLDCAIQIEPDNADYYFRRSLGFFGKKAYHQAVVDLNRAIELNPDEPLYYSMRGESNYSKQAYSLAIADYTRAIELDPHNKDLYFGRGTIYFMTKRKRKATFDFQEALALGHPEASAALARCHSWWGFLELFFDWLKRFLTK